MLVIMYNRGSGAPIRTICASRVKVLGSGRDRVLTCTDTNSIKHSIHLQRIIEIKRA